MPAEYVEAAGASSGISSGIGVLRRPECSSARSGHSASVTVLEQLFRDPAMPYHFAADIIRRVDHDLLRRGVDLGIASSDKAPDFPGARVTQHQYRIAVCVPDNLQSAV